MEIQNTLDVETDESVSNTENESHTDLNNIGTEFGALLVIETNDPSNSSSSASNSEEDLNMENEVGALAVKKTNGPSNSSSNTNDSEADLINRESEDGTSAVRETNDPSNSSSSASDYESDLNNIESEFRVSAMQSIIPTQKDEYPLYLDSLLQDFSNTYWDLQRRFMSLIRAFEDICPYEIDCAIIEEHPNLSAGTALAYKRYFEIYIAWFTLRESKIRWHIDHIRMALHECSETYSALNDVASDRTSREHSTDIVLRLRRLFVYNSSYAKFFLRTALERVISYLAVKDEVLKEFRTICSIGNRSNQQRY